MKTSSFSHNVRWEPNFQNPGQSDHSYQAKRVRATTCPSLPVVLQCRTANYTSLGTVQNLRRRRVSPGPENSGIPLHENVTTGDPERTTNVSSKAIRPGQPGVGDAAKSYARATGDNPNAVVYSGHDRQTTLPDSAPDTIEVTEPRVNKPPLAESEPPDEAWWMVILQQSSIGALNNYLKHNHHLLRTDAANGQKHSLLFHQVRELLKTKPGQGGQGDLEHWSNLQARLENEMLWLSEQVKAGQSSLKTVAYVANNITAFLELCDKSKRGLASALVAWLDKILTDDRCDWESGREPSANAFEKYSALLLNSLGTLREYVGACNDSGLQKLQEQLLTRLSPSFINPQGFSMIFRGLAELGKQGKTIGAKLLERLQTGLTVKKISKLNCQAFSNIYRALAELGLQGKSINAELLERLQTGLTDKKISKLNCQAFSNIFRALAELGLQGKIIDAKLLEHLQTGLTVEKISELDCQAFSNIFRALAELGLQGKSINAELLERLQTGLTVEKISELDCQAFSNIFRALAELGLQGESINAELLERLQTGLTVEKISELDCLAYSNIFRALAELGKQGKVIDARLLEHLQAGLTPEKIRLFDGRTFAMIAHSLGSLGIIGFSLFEARKGTEPRRITRIDSSSWGEQDLCNSAWALSVALVKLVGNPDQAIPENSRVGEQVCQWVEVLKQLLEKMPKPHEDQKGINQAYLADCVVWLLDKQLAARDELGKNVDAKISGVAGKVANTGSVAGIAPTVASGIMDSLKPDFTNTHGSNTQKKLEALFRRQARAGQTVSSEYALECKGHRLPPVDLMCAIGSDKQYFIDVQGPCHFTTLANEQQKITRVINGATLLKGFLYRCLIQFLNARDTQLRRVFMAIKPEEVDSVIAKIKG